MLKGKKFDAFALTCVHSAKSCHYAAALSTEDTYSLTLPLYILSFPG